MLNWIRHSPSARTHYVFCSLGIASCSLLTSATEQFRKWCATFLREILTIKHSIENGSAKISARESRSLCCAVSNRNVLYSQTARTTACRPNFKISIVEFEIPYESTLIRYWYNWKDTKSLDQHFIISWNCKVYEYRFKQFVECILFIRNQTIQLELYLWPIRLKLALIKQFSNQNGKGIIKDVLSMLKFILNSIRLGMLVRNTLPAQDHSPGPLFILTLNILSVLVSETKDKINR